MLLYLWIAFKVWMIVDAMRRGVHPLWYLVLLVPPGSFIYFFMVKLGDFNVRNAANPDGAASSGEPRADELDVLRATVETSASFDNRVTLAWALVDADQPKEAAEHFELALRSHRADKDARFGLGLAKAAQGELDHAAEHLSAVIDSSFAYRDYAVATELVEVLYQLERTDDSLSLLEAVWRHSRRIAHQLGLAKYQQRAQRTDAARATLRTLLSEFEAMPDYLRRRYGALATEARRLLRVLDA